MPVSLQIEFDKKQHEEILHRCSLLASETEINKAINRAAKRAADTAKAETVRQLASEYTLPTLEIRKTITTRTIGAASVGAVMDISSSPFALTKFDGVLPKEIMPPAKGPVIVKVKKTGGSILKHAFVAKMKSGHVGVYERKSDKAFPIEQKFGPSTPGMFGRENETQINQAVIQKAGETFNKRVIHELERLMYG